MRNSRASAGRSSGRTKRPTFTVRPCPDTSISEWSPAAGSTRTRSRLNSARSRRRPSPARPPAALPQRNPFAIRGMPRIRQEMRYPPPPVPARQNGRTSLRTLKPEKAVIPATPDTARRTSTQLGRCDRAIALQEPVDALARDSGEAENRIRHGVMLKKTAREPEKNGSGRWTVYQPDWSQIVARVYPAALLALSSPPLKNSGARP
jgi:hypothetical protein